MLPLHARLDVVIAAHTENEPRERVFNLVGVVHPRLRNAALLRGQGLERQRRGTPSLIASVVIEAGIAKRDVFLRPCHSQGVEARVAEHRVERAHYGLIDVALLARSLEGGETSDARVDDLIQLRAGPTSVSV